MSDRSFAMLAFVTVVVACSAGGEAPTPGASQLGSGSSASGGARSQATGGTGAVLVVPGDEGGASGDDACAVAILGQPGSNPGANFSAWLAARGPVVERYSPGPELSTLTAAALAEYEVVLLDQLPPGTALGITPEELALWVHGGGKLIALSGYVDDAAAPVVQNQMLAPLGLGFVTTEVLRGPVTQFAPHPIATGLTSVSFIGGREVTSTAEDTVVMAVGDPARPVGVAAARSAGKAFIFGDEWITFDSEWAALPEIQQLWVNVFDWLGGCKLTPVVS